MNTSELLDKLTGCGVLLAVDGDRLKVDAPKGALSADLRLLLVEHKTALMAQLAGAAEHSSPGTELVALYNAWCDADEPHSPKWVRSWAEAMIAAGYGCYRDGTTDTGADGWRAWATETPCHWCGRSEWWIRPADGRQVCSVCHPQLGMSLT